MNKNLRKQIAFIGIVSLMTQFAFLPTRVGAVATAEPYLVKDISPGLGSSSPDYSAGPVKMGDFVYWDGNDGVNGYELRKSDGTEAGTVMVKDIYPGPSDSGPSQFTAIGTTLYFGATDGVNGQELWKSDGTEAGTVMLKDIYPGIDGSDPYSFTNVNGTLYFTADDGPNGYELWKSDGTEAGTVMLKDIYPGISDSWPNYFTYVNGTLNGTLYFTAANGPNGYELWKSDGTEAGTVMVKDIYPGTGDSYPVSFTNVNGTLYFTADDGTNGGELWKSDGTEAGTVMVKDINPDIYGLDPDYFTNVNGTLYFRADDGTNGAELWKSDGTEAGTVMVKDIYTGANGSSPTYLILIGQKLFFFAQDDVHGMEPWALDVSADLPADTTPPTFDTLPNSTTPINLTEGQTITTNPYIIKVKPNDAGGIQKVEFYVDNTLICTATTPDADGVYSCSWDTSKYHSTVRVVAFDNSENSSTLTRNTTVDPSLYTLSKTGMSFLDYFRYIFRAIFGR